MIGDINEDNIINILDTILLVNIVLDNGYDSSADINNDAIINILDVVVLVNIILN